MNSIRSLFPEMQCHACKEPLEAGRFFCKICGRLRGSSARLQLAKYEILIGIIGVLAIGAFFSFSLFDNRTAQLQATRTPIEETSMPPSTKTPFYTKTPVPTFRLSPTSPPIYIGYARITNQVFRVNLRSSPGYISKDDEIDVIVEIQAGEKLSIIAGPESADGISWWLIEWKGYKGWIAERTGSGKRILDFL